MYTHTELYISMYACKELLAKFLYANDLGNRILYVRMQTHAHTHTHTVCTHCILNLKVNSCWKLKLPLLPCLLFFLPSPPPTPPPPLQSAFPGGSYQQAGRGWDALLGLRQRVPQRGRQGRCCRLPPRQAARCLQLPLLRQGRYGVGAAPVGQETEPIILISSRESVLELCSGRAGLVM